jgi:hypothetical protein
MCWVLIISLPTPHETLFHFSWIFFLLLPDNVIIVVRQPPHTCIYVLLPGREIITSRVEEEKKVKKVKKEAGERGKKD